MDAAQLLGNTLSPGKSIDSSGSRQQEEGLGGAGCREQERLNHHLQALDLYGRSFS